jgi:iron complex transport system permease protein
MKILIDVDQLQQEGVLTPALANVLRKHAVRDTGSTAINLLLAFGAIVLAAGAGALMPSPTVALLFGIAFLAAGWFITKNYAAQWGKLGSIWMIIGTLITAGALGMLVGYSVQGDVVVEHPLLASLVAALVLAAGAWVAQSQLLIALVPLAISSAIGGSTGYWHASYMLCIQEATITIVVFTALGLAGWLAVQKLKGAQQALALTFTRMCVILVNLGFWIGSLWGDTPGALWRGTDESSRLASYYQAPTIPATTFIVGWAVALLAAGIWGAQNGRRFLVNTIAVFGAIHFYTQWFEHLGADPLSVMIAGAATIGFGLALWKYNQKQIGG